MDTTATWAALEAALAASLEQPTPKPEQIAELDALAAACAGEPAEGYALALALSRLHEARDSTERLDSLNARLLEWQLGRRSRASAASTASSPSTAASAAPGSGRWPLVLADGLALVAMHSTVETAQRNELGRSLLRQLAEFEPGDLADRRIALRALVTALAHSQLGADRPVRNELDLLAAQLIAAVPVATVEVGRWWVERTLVELFDFHIERRAEPSIEELLEASAAALAASADPVTRFKHARNQFEWARILKDAAGAKQALEAMRHAQLAIGPRSRALSVVLLRSKAALAIDGADHVAAERHVRDAIALADTLAASANQRMALWTSLSAALSAQERIADAARAVEKAATYAQSQHLEVLTTIAHLLHARSRWSGAWQVAINHLEAGMAIARAANYSQFLLSHPALAAWAVARCLDHDIEAAFAAEVVSRRGLVPPADAGPRWPWAIRIRMLGGWSLEGASISAAAGGKAQQKPLQVIQLLAIAGPKGLERANLARAVYGSALLDSPATLNMAISRARRLLGDDSLIDNRGSRILLDPSRVYVDLWAMDALKPATGDEAVWQCQHLLEVYGGPLLAGCAAADEQRMAAATVRDRFVALVVRLAAQLPPETAIPCLRDAIARERSAEPLYRMLIELLAEQGDAAEAVAVYQQCETALGEAYGVAPSERTQRLVEAIRSKSPSRAVAARGPRLN